MYLVHAVSVVIVAFDLGMPNLLIKKEGFEVNSYTSVTFQLLLFLRILVVVITFASMFFLGII